MTQGPVLGIDLGTTNSVVAVVADGHVRVLADEGGNRLVPSVVSFHPGGEVRTGYTARERRLLDARNTIYSVKRLIGRPYTSDEVRRARDRFSFGFEQGPTGGTLVVARGETYTLPEISAFVLREVRAIAEAALARPCDRAVITVPANFNELQRNATKAAGRVAGMDVVRILNEPTAAALAYGLGRSDVSERVAVYDLGGGTFDITILELAGDVFEVVSTAGDSFLGGDDVDVLLADRMADGFLDDHRIDLRKDAQAYERLRAAAEWAKCQLSVETDVELCVEELAYGEQGASLDLNFRFTRAELEEMIRPLLARSFDVCEEAMEVAKLRPTQLDNVVLVGGATRIPLVRSMVSEYFGRDPLSSIDPDLVVAQGAAVQGAALGGEKARVSLPAAPAARPADPPLAVDEAVPAGPAFAPREQSQTGLAGVPGPGTSPAPDLAAVLDPAGASLGPGLENEAVLELDDLGAVVLGEPSARPAAAPAIPPPPPPGPGAAVYGQVDGGDLTETATKVASMKRQDLEDEDRVTSAPPAAPAAQGAGASDMPPLQLPALDLPPISSPPSDAPRVSGTLLGSGAPSPGELLADAPFEGAAKSAPDFDLAVPEGNMPLLLDVTPHSLGIETAASYCEVVIARNAAIPVEQTRLFSTSQDGQQVVQARISQGESRKMDDNDVLGELELQGLRPAPRGTVQIAVTFLLDVDGTLSVSAKDMDTGVEQATKINLVGGIDDTEITQMHDRQQLLLGESEGD